jgi:hypothetical protein
MVKRERERRMERVFLFPFEFSLLPRPLLDLYIDIQGHLRDLDWATNRAVSQSTHSVHCTEQVGSQDDKSLITTTSVPADPWSWLPPQLST